jgi:hypothetical protein
MMIGGFLSIATSVYGPAISCCVVYRPSMMMDIRILRQLVERDRGTDGMLTLVIERYAEGYNGPPNIHPYIMLA